MFDQQKMTPNNSDEEAESLEARQHLEETEALGRGV